MLRFKSMYSSVPTRLDRFDRQTMIGDEPDSVLGVTVSFLHKSEHIHAWHRANLTNLLAFDR
jgi:hypothetical protein